MVALLWGALDHVEYLGGFGESRGAEALLDFLSRHLVGAAEEVQPCFDRISDYPIIVWNHVLWQLKKMNLQPISQVQIATATAQTKIAVDFR